MMAAQPDVCKSNSSSTDSQLTMSHGPSASDEDEQNQVVETLSVEEVVVDEVNYQVIKDETPSMNCKPVTY